MNETSQSLNFRHVYSCLSLSACFTRTHSRTHSCCCWYLDRSDSASEMKSDCSREDEMVPIEYLTAECSWRIPALPHPHPHWGWGGHELVSKVSLNKVQLPKPSQELKKCWYVLIIGLPSFFFFLPLFTLEDAVLKTCALGFAFQATYSTGCLFSYG